jgi:hypothetical protein
MKYSLIATSAVALIAAANAKVELFANGKGSIECGEGTRRATEVECQQYGGWKKLRWNKYAKEGGYNGCITDTKKNNIWWLRQDPNLSNIQKPTWFLHTRYELVCAKGSEEEKVVEKEEEKVEETAEAEEPTFNEGSLQAHLKSIEASLDEDERAVNELAASECTNDAAAVVDLTGAISATNSSCGSLGVVSGCDAASHSYSLISGYASTENSKCSCERSEVAIQNGLQGDIDAGNAEIARLLGIKNTETAEAEAIIAKFVSSGSLSNMDKAVATLKSLLAHVNESGLSSTLLQTHVKLASRALNKISNGNHLVSLLETAVDRTYTAYNKGETESEDTASPAQRLIQIIEDLITYIADERKDIQGQVDAEKADMTLATETYNTEKVRIEGEIADCEEKKAAAYGREQTCTSERTAAASAFGTAVSNAQQSHGSFQAYVSDIRKERDALVKIAQILIDNHFDHIKGAVNTANANSGNTTELYDTTH